MDRRKHERFSRRVQVRFWPRGQPEKEKIGYTRDISEGGAFLVTPKPLKKGVRLRLEFGPEEEQGFLLEAVVARSVPVPRELQARGIKTAGMGLRFLRVRELLQELLPHATTGAPVKVAEGARSERERARIDEPRGHEPTARPSSGDSGSGASHHATGGAESSGPNESSRVSTATTSRSASGREAGASGRPGRSQAYRTETWPDAERRRVHRAPRVLRVMRYPVHFPSLEVFLSSWERDLRFGGLFVSTSQPAELDSEVELELRLPESDIVLRVRAQVVHVHGPETATGEPNLVAGMGVQFDDPEVLSSLESYAASVRSVR